MVRKGSDVKSILKGAFDMHIHSAPDVVGRKLSDIEVAKKNVEAGLRGFVIKSHQFNTGARAKLIMELFPDLEVFGGVALNRAMGGINPAAVEMAGQLGAKMVWFPTIDSKSEQEFYRKTGRPKSYGAGNPPSIEILPITIFNESGELVEEVYTVLELIKRYSMILCTGHLSKEEALSLIEAGRKAGVQKMIVTHPEFPACYATIEEQLEYVEHGAKIEHCYHTIWSGGCTYESIIEQIKEVGPQNIVLTSDLGQIGSPDPADGLTEFVNNLISLGNISEEDIRKMIVENPALLLE